MIAIIPARGGSKGLPGKNIKLLKEKPLIQYTIEAALSARNISRVIVSTDDQEIANISLECGADVPFLRPEHLATDTATSKDVIKYCIERIENDEQISINNFILLQPTSPLRGSQDIDNAIEHFYAKNAQAVISFCAENHPIRWHKYIDDQGKLQDIFDNVKSIRQEEKKSYYPNGAIYVFDRSSYINEQLIIEKQYAYIMPRSRSIDIDTLEDFEYCEFLLNKASGE